MKTEQILTADVLDIIFDGRNKDYGAYELRKEYSKRLRYALATMFVLVFLFIAFSIWAKNVDVVEKQLEGFEVFLSDHVEKKQEIIPIIQKPSIPKSLVKQVIFTTPTIVKNHLYDYQTPPPDQSSLDNVVIGAVNIDGNEIGNTITPPIESIQTGIAKEGISNNNDYEKEFTTVQIPASFPGGQENWKRYLERSLNRELPSENGAAPGIYSVIISFIVDKEGNIGYTQIEKDAGFGTAEEAIRIIKKGPKWLPAIQNGKQVIYRVKQVISFVVQAEYFL